MAAILKDVKKGETTSPETVQKLDAWIGNAFPGIKPEQIRAIRTTLISAASKQSQPSKVDTDKQSQEELTKALIQMSDPALMKVFEEYLATGELEKLFSIQKSMVDGKEYKGALEFISRNLNDVSLVTDEFVAKLKAAIVTSAKKAGITLPANITISPANNNSTLLIQHPNQPLSRYLLTNTDGKPSFGQVR